MVYFRTIIFSAMLTGLCLGGASGPMEARADVVHHLRFSASAQAPPPALRRLVLAERARLVAVERARAARGGASEVLFAVRAERATAARDQIAARLTQAGLAREVADFLNRAPR